VRAGLEPGVLNPLAVEVMRETGIDISRHETKSVLDFFKQGKLYRYVITVCDETAAESCPIFPGITTRLHWSFTDPAMFTGSLEERREKTRRVRDEIKAKVEAFIAEVGNAGA
jgi:arsenate reductase (thioredoxin)